MHLYLSDISVYGRSLLHIGEKMIEINHVIIDNGYNEATQVRRKGFEERTKWEYKQIWGIIQNILS
jgi:hypothetical protein